MRPNSRLFISGLSLLVLLIFFAPLFSLVKVSADGATPRVVLAKTWGGPKTEGSQGIAVDSHGNIYITGFTYSFRSVSNQNSDTFLLKYNPSGSLLWQRTWGGNGTDQPSSVEVDSAGNIYVVGITNSFTHSPSCPGCFDVFILKFDPAGNLIWQKTWGDSWQYFAKGVAVDSSDNIYVTGQSSNYNGIQTFILKINSTGQLIWQRAWGTGLSIASLDGSVALDSHGNIFVTGSLQTSNGDERSIYLFKVNSTGNLLWQYLWGDGNHDETDAIAADSSGAVYLTGHNHTLNNNGSCSFHPCDSLLLMKVDENGSMIWQNVWKNADLVYGLGVAVDPSHYAYVTGVVLNPGGGGAVFLKVNSLGQLVYQGVLTSGVRWSNGIAADAYGNATIIGSVSNPPPYRLYSTNAPYVASNFPRKDVIMQILPTSLPFGNLRGLVSTPNGIETFAGESDALLLRYSNTGTYVNPPSQPFASPTFNGVLFLGGIAAAVLVIQHRVRALHHRSKRDR